MSDFDVSLVPVRVAEIVAGKPLPRSVYDCDGKLLLAAGRTVDSAGLRDKLIANGFVRDEPFTSRPRPMPVPPRKSLLASAVPKPAAPSPSKEVVVAMEDVRWYVGETIYLQQIDNSATRYAVRLIGFMKGKLVFVTAPVSNGKLEFVKEGQAFVARAFSGKKAYAFVVTVVKVNHGLHPFMQLSYPKDVRCTVVRKGVRAEVELIATISIPKLEHQSTVTLIDLSVGGASFVADHVLASKGALGKIKFKVLAADQDESVNLNITFRSIAPNDNGEGYKHGIEFLDMQTRDRLILSAFVHQTLAEGD